MAKSQTKRGRDDVALAEPAFELKPGSTVSGVRLVEPIETGAKIASWRGQRSGGSACTLHVLLKGSTTRERDTFLKAAKKLASLRDGTPIPGVVAVTEVSFAADLYIAELSASGTMADLPVLDWEFSRKLGFLRRIGLVLSQMHKKNLFHGCIRPQNILLDEQLEPVLTDVGVILIEDSFPGTAETRHEYWAYAAREVRQGQAPDARSDAFSFGRLLQFVLLGQDPDEIDDPLPRLDSLRDSPAGLVRIVRKATQRDAAQRHASIDELLDELARYATDQVGVAHPEGLEGKERPKEAPAEAEKEKKEPKKAKPEEKVRVEPIQVVVGPRKADGKDPLAGTRAPAVGALGLVAVAGACGLAYRAGEVGKPILALGILGAVLGSALLPGTSRPYFARAIWAAVCVALLWFGEPLEWAAGEGRKARFLHGSPTERATAVVGLARHGRKDFRSLDLNGIDFGGKNLGGLDFSGTNLSSARFVNTDLAGAKLMDADVSHADFGGANLEGTDVGSTVGWRDALCDADTRMPTGWSCADGKPKSAHDITGVH